MKYKPVNWVDGMRLSSEQFVTSDLYVEDKVRDAISLRLDAYNYGILPVSGDYPGSFNCELVAKASRMLELRVRSCQAITADGSRIHIDSQTDDQDGITFSHHFDEILAANAAIYLVMLQVDPFARVPEGEVDADEQPARRPFVGAGYKVYVVPEIDNARSAVEPRSVVLGRIKLVQGGVRVDEQFIPPCTSMLSHPQLTKFYQLFSTAVQQVQLASFAILDKTAGDISSTTLAKSLRLVTERITDFLAQHIFSLRHQLRQGPPVDFIGFFCHFSQVLFNGIRCLTKKDREDLLKYFYEWRDISPANFEELLAETMEIQYHHGDIAASFALIEEFLKEIRLLWERLAALEYIGQHKENIVVAEQQQVQQVQTRKIWTLLD